MYLFEDRKDAGRKLSRHLNQFQFTEPIVLALPRGGVVVADEVAKVMNVPLDVVIARKIGAPGQPEYGIGALSEDEYPTFNPMALDYFDPNDPEVSLTIHKEIEELHRRIELYREGKNLPDLKGRSVIVVDDGVATGVTAVAAAHYLRTLSPKEIILAVPVGPSQISKDIRDSYDRVLCLYPLDNLMSVGSWYHYFEQTEDDEVLDILKKYH